MTEKSEDPVDWGLATWDGAKREALRRWAKLPLERVIAALEEMQELNDALRASDASVADPQHTAGVQESPGNYGSGTSDHATADKEK